MMAVYRRIGAPEQCEASPLEAALVLFALAEGDHRLSYGDGRSDAWSRVWRARTAVTELWG